MCKIYIKPTPEALKAAPDTFLAMNDEGYIDTEKEGELHEQTTVQVRFEGLGVTEQWRLVELQMIKLTQ